MPAPEKIEQTGPMLSLRAAETDDDAFLFSLFSEIRAPEFGSLGWEADRLEALLRSQFDAQVRDYSHRFPDAERSVVLADGVLVGTIWVHRSEDEVRLLDIIVAADRRNTGIGTRLLRQLQAEARHARKPLRHMVAMTNTQAMRFYERLGFVVVADVGSHLLMEWRPAV